MATEVILPKVDMVMENATFVEWLKGEGDQVEKGQPLFVIMTDKAAMEIESPASGILSGVKAQPDQVIPVSETIAYILQQGEDLPIGSQPPMPDVEETATKKASAPPLTTEEVKSIRTDEVRGEVRATPLARRMATELGIDLSSIQGRGPKGRVHRADVLEAVERGDDLVVAATTSMPQYAFADLDVPLPDARKRDVIPLAGPRKIIADRMAYSASLAPHINLTASVDMSEAVRLRSKVKDQIEKKTGYRPSLTAIIARAVATILPRHPYLNSSLVGDEVILWEDVHLGIATSLDDYLIVPVIRQTQDKHLEQIAAELGDLLERARAKRLAPSEMSGSTFTISNLGMYGIESFTAIINPPESAILAVGSIVDKLVRIDAQMEPRPMMGITICADHRVVDGAAAANFLIEVKNTLENPYLLI